tara:strand:+ start:986 stop:1228 length:243 start_codon:yes stop_codon:yes gene_type:complete
LDLNKKRLIIGVLWPSFWMAIILSGLVFSALDPLIIASQLGFHHISYLAAYSIGFFFFWLICAWSGFFSITFSRGVTRKK